MVAKQIVVSWGLSVSWKLRPTLTRPAEEKCTLPSCNHFLVLHSHKIPPTHSLCAGDEQSEAVISHLFQKAQQTSLEKHLKKIHICKKIGELSCVRRVCPPSPQLRKVLTLVCPNLYWVWSISMEPSSFSQAFLLSINWPSGMALAFRTRYLPD